MANTIKVKTGTSTPTYNDLALGELGFNTSTNGLYVGKGGTTAPVLIRASNAATLTTARTLKIGNTGKTFNGSANVTWTLAEIGAAAASHSHDYANAQGRVITDFNAGAFRVSGMYGENGTASNSPGGSYKSLIVSANIDVGLQITGGHSSDNLYFRGWHSSGSTYTSWRTVLHSGNYTSYAATSNHTHAIYLPLGGGTMTGQLTVNNVISSHNKISITNTPQRIMTNPADQLLVLNSHQSTVIDYAPGIGFHIPSVIYCSLKMVSDGSFRFYNSSLTAYVPIHTSIVYTPQVSTASSYLNLTTPSGYLRMGPQNGSWCHFDTDRPKFYFYKPINVLGTDVSLVNHGHTAITIRSTITLSNNGTTTFTDSRGCNMYIVYAEDSTTSAWIPVVVTNVDLGAKMTHRTYTNCYPFILSRSGTTLTLKREGTDSVKYSVASVGV